MNIIARKPRSEAGHGCVATEWIVVERPEGTYHRWVVATASAQSLKHEEWFWGHYYDDRAEAMDHFNKGNGA